MMATYSFRPMGEPLEETLNRAVSDLKRTRQELNGEREYSDKLRRITEQHASSIPFCDHCKHPTSVEPETCSVCEAFIPCEEWCSAEKIAKGDDHGLYCSSSNHHVPPHAQNTRGVAPSIIICEDCAVDCVVCKNTVCTDCCIPCVQCADPVCDDCVATSAADNGNKDRCANCCNDLLPPPPPPPMMLNV